MWPYSAFIRVQFLCASLDRVAGAVPLRSYVCKFLNTFFSTAPFQYCTVEGLIKQGAKGWGLKLSTSLGLFHGYV